MKNKDLYVVVTIAILLLIAGIYLFFGKEPLSKVPLKTWILEIAIFLGFFYSLIIGIEIRNKNFKFVFAGLQIFLFVILIIISYSIFKIIKPV